MLMRMTMTSMTTAAIGTMAAIHSLVGADPGRRERARRSARRAAGVSMLTA